MPDGYLTAAAVAARLGVSGARVRQLLAEGRFPGAHRHGRDWLVPVGAVDAFRRLPRSGGRRKTERLAPQPQPAGTYRHERRPTMNARLRVHPDYGSSVGGSVAAERKRRTSAHRLQPLPPAEWGGEWGEWEQDPFYRNHLFRRQIGTGRYLMARFRSAAGAEKAMRRWNRENARTQPQ